MKTSPRISTLLLAVGFCLNGVAAESRPNVIFILTDDQGWGDTAYNGHPYALTPNIDKLASDGIVLPNFYVNGPVCSPSRVGFMTGKYPAREGFHHITSRPVVNDIRQVPDWLDPNVTTVADVFRSAGYTTVHYGKWHIGKYGKSPRASEYGFDEAASVSGPGADSLARRYKLEEASPDIMTDLTFDAGIEFIRTQGHRPFYMQLWTPLPHAPLDYTEIEIHPLRHLSPNPGDPAFAPWMAKYIRDAKNPAEQMQNYLTAIGEIDKNVGRLMRELKELGIDENTIVVFSSDNGPEDYNIGNSANAGMGSAGPFRGRKRSIYEGGVRVPFIARWPGRIPAGREDQETIMSGIDFLPTMAGLAGVKVDIHGIDGEDLSQSLLGSPVQRQQPLYWEWFFEIVGDPDYFSPPLAVREGNWKFYTDYAGEVAELYDLQQDPSELVNVAESNPEVVGRLKRGLLAWVETLPPAPLRKAVAEGADRMKLLDIRKPMKD